MRPTDRLVHRQLRQTAKTTFNPPQTTKGFQPQEKKRKQRIHSSNGNNEEKFEFFCSNSTLLSQIFRNLKQAKDFVNSRFRYTFDWLYILYRLPVRKWHGTIWHSVLFVQYLICGFDRFVPFTEQRPYYLLLQKKILSCVRRNHLRQDEVSFWKINTIAMKFYNDLIAVSSIKWRQANRLLFIVVLQGNSTVTTRKCVVDEVCMRTMWSSTITLYFQFSQAPEEASSLRYAMW